MPLPDVARERPPRQRDRGDPFLSQQRAVVAQDRGVKPAPRDQAAAPESAEFGAVPYATWKIVCRAPRTWLPTQEFWSRLAHVAIFFRLLGAK